METIGLIIEVRKQEKIDGQYFSAFDIDTTEQLLELCKLILDEHSAKVMRWDHDGVRKPLLIDAFSASMMKQVADVLLAGRNREKLLAMEPIIALDTLMKVAGKAV